MLRTLFSTLLATVLFVAPSNAQGVPQTLSYQGVLSDLSGVPLPDGAHDLDFAIYPSSAATTPLWSESLTVSTVNGLFSVILGQSVPLSLDFDLPYWIGMAVDGDAELTPRLELTASPYSLTAKTVEDDAIVDAKIADGTVVRSLNGITDDVNLVGSGSITITPAGNDLVIGGTGGSGDSDWAINGGNMYALPTGNVGVGTTSPASDFHVADDNFQTRLLIEDETPGTVHRTTITMDNQEGAFNFDYVTLPSGGVDRMTMGSNATDLLLHGRLLEQRADVVETYVLGEKRMSVLGAETELYDDNGTATIELNSETRGRINLRRDSGALGLSLDADPSTGAAITGYDDAGDLAYWINSASASGTASITLYDTATNTQTLALTSRAASGAGALLALTQSDGDVSVQIDAQETGSATQGGQILLFDDSGDQTIEIDGDFGSTNSGAIRLYNAAGTATVQMLADQSGDGRLIADVVEIRGGADLSERFVVDETPDLRPGMVVSIDPNVPGALKLSTMPRDRRVAGVISGAGGISPGMIMSESGTIADGEHPVALTGRVYVYVDADFGAVEPGDLLTTSAVPGHAMRVSRYEEARGAVIGKAMTRLDSGRGLVLVLVGLQ